MLFNTVINIDVSSSVTHNINTSTLCFILLLLLYMINNTLNIVANINARNSIITPSTTITIEISIVNASIPSILIHSGINGCRTVVTAIAIIVVVTLATITMIAKSPLLSSFPVLVLLLLLVLRIFLSSSVSTNPITTTISTAITNNICVKINGRSNTTTFVTAVMVGINMISLYYKFLLFVFLLRLMLLTLLLLPSFLKMVLDLLQILLLVPLVLLS